MSIANVISCTYITCLYTPLNLCALYLSEIQCDRDLDLGFERGTYAFSFGGWRATIVNWAL